MIFGCVLKANREAVESNNQHSSNQIVGGAQGSPFRFSTESRQLPETKFRLKFRRISLIPNEKRIQIQKTKFRWIPTEISVIPTEISVIWTEKYFLI